MQQLIPIEETTQPKSLTIIFIYTIREFDKNSYKRERYGIRQLN